MRASRTQTLNLILKKKAQIKDASFLKIFYLKNETSEQNSNGYCNVNFEFTFDPKNPSFICDIKLIFSIMNLYLYLKCIPSDLISIS